MKQRSVEINIVNKFDKKKDLQYWLSKTPSERIDAVEFLRDQYFALIGYETIPRFVSTVQLRMRK